MAQNTISAMAPDAGDRVKGAADSARAAAYAVSDKISDITDRATTKVKHVADQAADQTSRLVDNANEAGADLLDATQRRANRSLSDAQNYVSRNPGTALLAAAGIGFFLGMLARR